MSKKLFEAFLTTIACEFRMAKNSLENAEMNGNEVDESRWSVDHPENNNEFINLNFGMCIFKNTCGSPSSNLRWYDHDEQLETIKKWVNKYD